MVKKNDSVEVCCIIDRRDDCYFLTIFVFDSDGIMINHSVCPYDTLKEAKTARDNAFACWLN